jgi:LysR family transcriptional activator of nhaA
MSVPLNYRHLYYFWVVANEGGMARGAQRLGMAVQTISAQVRALEQELGHALFKPAGRGMALTDAGKAAMGFADQIFQLGEQLQEAVHEAATGQGLRLAVGMSDGLPKLVAHHLLQPALQDPRVRLLCHEDEFDRLLADLALHRLDVVLSDRPAPPNPNLRLYSHRIGEGSRGVMRSASRRASRSCPCCCRRRIRPCAWASTSGSSARASARASPASSRTAPCSRRSAGRAWACSRRRAGRRRNC